MRRIAVIGSGAAGYAVIRRLLEHELNAQICLFDLPELPRANANVDDIYREKRKSGIAPLSKTFFGYAPEKLASESKKHFYKSEFMGGWTNLWGANLRPLPEPGLKDYYQRVSDWLGISGENDELESYYGETYFNRPPVQMHPGLVHLKHEINSSAEGFFAAGSSRMALETRPDQEKSCRYCGDCFVGCQYHSVFSPVNDLKSWIRDGRILFFQGKVQTLSDSSVNFESNGELKTESDFEKIYLCAGAVGSARIMKKSISSSTQTIVQDSALFQFPIFSFFGSKKSKTYLALSNLILAAPDAEVQIHPHPEYFLRSLLPAWLWRVAKPLDAFLRQHLFWGRLYLSSQYGFHFQLDFESSGVKLKTLKTPNRTLALKYHAQLQKTLRWSPFWLPSWALREALTSSHLAGSLYGFPNPFKNVLICDSSVFPESPATPLTFTVMAQACRIVDQSL